MVLVMEMYCSSNFKDSIDIPVECITIFGCMLNPPLFGCQILTGPSMWVIRILGKWGWDGNGKRKREQPAENA